MEIKAQLSRLGLFDSRAPRYTSYPTATHFKNDIGPGHYLDWVGQLTPETPISIYLHIPFCRRLCWFCACRTQGTTTMAPVRAYLDTLLAEVAMLRSALPQGVKVARIHWGGGTPTLLAPDMMHELAAAVRTLAELNDDVEFSVEIDPSEIDEARLDALASEGMNRASIGVQDFDPDIQDIIGRSQTFEITAQTVEALRARDIHSLNADILYGLPSQTPDKITDSVQKLLSLSPDRVALYGYAHVPWMARRQTMIPADQLPTPQERLKLFETARRLFLWDGYSEIGIDHFARKSDGLDTAQRTGHLRRNFQGYVDDKAPVLIGLGASAISRFPGGFAQNASGTAAYTNAIRAGQFATVRGHAFKGDDLMRARLIEALMCDFAINSDEIIEGFGTTRAQLEKMYRQASEAFPDMVRITSEGIEIVHEGRPLTRMIARTFDTYEMSENSHSGAI
ncbi:MAG: oxygen-independent coproporphyrinogen-3 oxidase [Sulfitobacter sp.]|jgi:oxygen-independent coproporphyrinogen-3 oxidase